MQHKCKPHSVKYKQNLALLITEAQNEHVTFGACEEWLEGNATSNHGSVGALLC